MKQSEQTNKLPITVDTFVNNIAAKIKNYKPDTLDNFISVSPYIQWDNVRINGDELLIEKSGKLFDGFSRYAKVSGTVYCKMTNESNTTILQARIVLDTAMADVLKYVAGFAFGLSGVTWLAFDFNFLILLGLLSIEAFIFFMTPIFQDAALEDLTDYYNRLISEVMTE